MPKLSPTYREDDVDSLPNDVRAYLDQHYLPTLENTTKQNPKLLVVFAGGNAVGKSTLAKRISQELNGVILENDGIKKWLLRYNPDINQDDLDTFTWKYAMNLYGRLDSITQNGLIIRDGIIHWYFDRILPIFEAQGYPVFIISMEPSTQKRIELIQARGETETTTTERLISIIPDHAIHMERFKKAHTPDVILDDTNLFDHDYVLQKLRDRLQSISVIR